MSNFDAYDKEHLTPEEREWDRLVYEHLNLPGLPKLPEPLTPRMAKIALQRFITLDQQFGSAALGVMMGVQRLNPELGGQMVDFIPKYFLPLQREIWQMIKQLEQMEDDAHDG